MQRVDEAHHNCYSKTKKISVLKTKRHKLKDINKSILQERFLKNVLSVPV